MTQPPPPPGDADPQEHLGGIRVHTKTGVIGKVAAAVREEGELLLVFELSNGTYRRVPLRETVRANATEAGAFHQVRARKPSAAGSEPPDVA